MLLKCCTQYVSKFGKLTSVFIPIPKKGNAKECWNYHTTALISHASKVMLKILQDSLQQYVNWELPDVQAGFGKGRGILSFGSTKTTPSCWTTINRKTLEPTKKKIIHIQRKKKPQQDGRRGTFTVKSNPISTRWVTHSLDNSITKEVPTLLCFPAWGSDKWTKNFQGIWPWGPVGFD